MKEMETFKGFHIFTIDGHYVEIQDYPQTREKNEFLTI